MSGQVKSNGPERRRGHLIDDKRRRGISDLDERPTKQQRITGPDDQDADLSQPGLIPPYNCKVLPKSTKDPPLPHLKPGALSDAVFTHASVADGKYKGTPLATYEQLEFYGDAAIEFISTRLIFHNFGTLLTGKQSTLRQSIVNNKTLAKFSKRYGFPDKLKCTQMLRQSPQWEKTCADVFEAYVAALVLSTPDGFSVAERWLTELWMPLLPQQAENTVGISLNYKDELQRKIGGYNVTIKYEKINDPILEAAAARGGQEMKVGVYLTGWGCQRQEIGQAVGIGKTEAGILAAKDAFERKDSAMNEIVEKKRAHDAKRKAEKEAKEHG
ncbi:hypothetical protein FH972_026094 [Carpinus fangiana]|uniref:RNase III domain-containing protein n=1 Tax=Carpinus fangiana TaxID=176857 RepID=A0A5N6L305_9ROSI|nr:hypothetical protein FH972_026094 [Carpinus fangiana]